MRKITFIGIIATLCLISSCKDDEPRGRSYSVRGLVQKGPFVIGTTLSIAELTSPLIQTGNTFSREIIDNAGSFNVSGVNLTSSFVELSASGFYFNEVVGEISTAPLTLKALSDLTNVSTVNVNVLTHLEKARVEYLVSEGNTFSQAKETAQSEVLAAFGMDTDNLDNSELLDIAFDNQGGAALLGLSVILQGNRSVGDLSEALATISNDLRDNGTIDNAALLTSLRAVARTLDLGAIRSNLQTRYAELGSVSAIPSFEPFIEKFLTFTGEVPVPSGLTINNTAAFSTDISVAVNPNSLSTTVTIEYGKTPDLGLVIDATPGVISGHGNVVINTNLSGLEPGETYYLRIKSENAKGIAYTDQQTFRTLGEVAIATTLEASGVEPSKATLHATVNPQWLETTLVFEYGPDTNYGSTAEPNQAVLPAGSDQNIEVTANITDLSFGQVYYFRIKAVNKLGTTVGTRQAFVAFHPIGTTYQGGLLAYTLRPGDQGFDPAMVHGLIVTPTDLGYGYRWADYDLTAPRGPSDRSIGTGQSNTNELILKVNTVAAHACNNLVSGGFDDWFLPSLDELKALKPNAQALGLATRDVDFYWSSTEAPPAGSHYPYNDAYMVNFSSIRPDIPEEKYRVRLVRPMRYF